MHFKKFILNNKYVCTCIIIMLFIGIWSTYSKSSVLSVFNSNISKRKLPIYCVETDKKQISISFDAAWGASILRTLVLLYNINNQNYLAILTM